MRIIEELQKLMKKPFRKQKAAMLAGMLCLCLTIQPMTVLADVWERVGNTYQMADGTPINGG